jgi:hypothetical protein
MDKAISSFSNIPSVASISRLNPLIGASSGDLISGEEIKEIQGVNNWAPNMNELINNEEELKENH